MNVGIDSGATRCVMPQRHCTDYPTAETSDKKIFFSKTCNECTAGYPCAGDGTIREAKLRVVDVSKALMSVSEKVKAGRKATS